jgi:hypothetical protein
MFSRCAEDAVRRLKSTRGMVGEKGCSKGFDARVEACPWEEHSFLNRMTKSALQVAPACTE